MVFYFLSIRYILSFHILQQLPHRQSVIRWQLAPRRMRTSACNKNTDEIVIVPNGSERYVRLTDKTYQLRFI